MNDMMMKVLQSIAKGMRTKAGKSMFEKPKDKKKKKNKEGLAAIVVEAVDKNKPEEESK